VLSDLLTHWGVFEDCRRLAQLDARIDPLFARLMHEEREFARLGALTRGGNRWVSEILTKARSAWSEGGGTTESGRKIAFALGGIAHYVADITLKPLMSEVAQADWNASHSVMQGHAPVAGDHQNPGSIREVSAYYDIKVFREVYLSGQEEPFNAFLAAANVTEPGQALEEFVRSLFQRALLSCHTLDPDRDNIEEWLDRLFGRVQPLYIDIDLYVRVAVAPDAAKMQRYRVETEFYVASDPVIAAARVIRRGTQPTQAQIDVALADDANRGGYGRSVALGIQRLREASAFWRGEVSETPDLKQSVRWKPGTSKIESKVESVSSTSCSSGFSRRGLAPSD
jgi:hypothetical protein